MHPDPLPPTRFAGPLAQVDVCHELRAALWNRISQQSREEPPKMVTFHSMSAALNITRDQRLRSSLSAPWLTCSPTNAIRTASTSCQPTKLAITLSLKHIMEKLAFFSAASSRAFHGRAGWRTKPWGEAAHVCIRRNVQALRRYSAAEWAAAEPVAAWDPALKAAHRRWGGGRELDHLSLIAFLDLLCQLQATADEVADAMLVISAPSQTNALSQMSLNTRAFMTRLAGCTQPPRITGH